MWYITFHRRSKVNSNERWAVIIAARTWEAAVGKLRRVQGDVSWSLCPFPKP